MHLIASFNSFTVAYQLQSYFYTARLNSVIFVCLCRCEFTEKTRKHRQEMEARDLRWNARARAQIAQLPPSQYRREAIGRHMKKCISTVYVTALYPCSPWWKEYLYCIVRSAAYCSSVVPAFSRKVYSQLVPKAHITLAVTISLSPKPNTNHSPNTNTIALTLTLTSSNEFTWGRGDRELTATPHEIRHAISLISLHQKQNTGIL